MKNKKFFAIVALIVIGIAGAWLMRFSFQGLSLLKFANTITACYTCVVMYETTKELRKIRRG